MAQGWLECESVESGMFSDELLVFVRRLNGKSESFFVPKADVKVGERKVKIEYSESGPLVLATLPTAQPVTISVVSSKVTP